VPGAESIREGLLVIKTSPCANKQLAALCPECVLDEECAWRAARQEGATDVHSVEPDARFGTNIQGSQVRTLEEDAILTEPKEQQVFSLHMCSPKGWRAVEPAQMHYPALHEPGCIE
jgi:hypothetical protein